MLIDWLIVIYFSVAGYGAFISGDLAGLLDITLFMGCLAWYEKMNYFSKKCTFIENNC